MTPGLLGTSGSILLAGLVAASAAPAATFTVTNTNDANAGSLRQAITDANAAAEPTRLRSTSRARARLRLRAAGVHGRRPGRPLSVHVREWDRAARHRADHRRLRRRQLLSAQ
jgi:tRNA U34 5-carboxymethylaminomethyl modifying enzyme MnmG/GidA